jgi:hypothetical protein
MKIKNKERQNNRKRDRKKERWEEIYLSDLKIDSMEVRWIEIVIDKMIGRKIERKIKR